jgi:uncharacterized membrane protein YraQ (UPF0718 family)
MTVVFDILNGAWQMLHDAGLYVAVGFLAAGLIHVLVSREWMTRHLGGRGFGTVVKAAIIGAPLPLCSCSVLPAAYALYHKGASRGATVSFLISTPETSVDSIAVTWALLGPVMAIVRPVAAVLTAMVAGFIEAVRGRHEQPHEVDPPACRACESDSCEHVERPSAWSRYWRFIIFEMADDVGPTLTVGLILAGIVTALVPDDFFEAYLADEWASMLVMLVVGLPLYVCATASTPLAAALAMKGLNPGAALVFLLVGPATNLATVLMVGRMLGRTSALLYVGTIAVLAMACGAALNAVTGALAAKVMPDHAHRLLPEWVYVVGGVVLAAYLLLAVARWAHRKLPRGGPNAPCCAEHDVEPRADAKTASGHGPRGCCHGGKISE